MSEITQTGGYLDVVDATLRAPRLEATSNIGIANTNPQHAFSVGSNLYIDTESSNVITVRGNVVTEGIKMGFLEITPSYDLAAVSNVGNITSNTIIFDNPIQGFVATGNATIGSTLTVTGFRITAAAAAQDDLEAITTDDLGADPPKVDAGRTPNAIHITNATESTTPYTGALQIGTNTGANGGLGVAGNVHVNQGVYTQDLSVSGEIVSNLAVNTDDLFVDIVNSRVGIGKTEPTVALDVVGAVNASGNVAVDTNTLFVDSVGNKVGVGTTEPGAALEITGNAYVSSNLEVGTANLFVDTVNSRVGIGTNAPGTKLSVYDVSSNLTAVSIITDGASVTNEPSFSILDMKDENGAGGYIKGFHNPFVSNGLQFGSIAGNSRSTEVMTILASGNVGIGTSNPLHKIDVMTSAGGTGLYIRGSNYGTNNEATHIRIGAGGGAANAHHAMITGGHTNSGRTYLAFSTISDYPTQTFNPVERMRIADNGNVGIGTTNPTGRFTLKMGPGNVDIGNGMRFIQQAPATNHWDIGTSTNADPNFVFAYNGQSKGYLNHTVGNSQLNFTGQHRTFIKDTPFTEAKNLEGLIVSSDQNKYIKMSGGIEAGSNAITTNESLPIVSLSNVVADKKCFGVISASEDPEKREEMHGNFGSVFEKEKGDTRVYINSVGEGAIWVTNLNGTLESGDYITTSNVVGYGQKQESEFLANYTVAKITMDCDFEPVTQPIQIIRKEMGDVNYWAKTTYENISEEEYSNLTDENRRIVDDVYQKITKKESKTEREGWELEVRQELVNVLDEHGQIQWEDDPSGATEKAYKIRYLDANGVETDEANAVHIAAFVGCTYHCG
jgi:hypothetical protein